MIQGRATSAKVGRPAASTIRKEPKISSPAAASSGNSGSKEMRDRPSRIRSSQSKQAVEHCGCGIGSIQPRRRRCRIATRRGGGGGSGRLFLFSQRPIALFIGHPGLTDCAQSTVEERLASAGARRLAGATRRDLAQRLEGKVGEAASLG